VENSSVKNTCEASILTDPDVLPPTCENKELSSHQDIVKTADKEVEAHPICLSKSVQCEIECQDCSDKSKIIASVRNFAECMLGKKMNMESMNMVLKIIGSVPEISNSSNLNIKQPADIENFVLGPSSRSETVACTKSSTVVNKNCLNSLEGQINPSLTSESASSPSSTKPENLETPPAAAKTPKYSGKDVAETNDLVNPAAKDIHKQMGSCEKLKPTENFPPLQTDRESKMDMPSKISCEHLDEAGVNLSTLTNTDGSSLLVSVTDNSAQSAKCDKDDAKQASLVSRKNIFSDGASLVKKGIIEKGVIVASANEPKSEIACCINKNPPVVVAPAGEEKICPLRQKTGLAKGAEKCTDQQPQTETRATSSGSVQKAKQVTKTQSGTAHLRPGSSGCQQAKSVPKPLPRPVHQVIKKGVHGTGSRQVKAPQWLAEEIRQSNWRNSYHSDNTWYNDQRPWSMPLLPTPLPALLQLRGLRPVFRSQEEEDIYFHRDAF
jgi:hypothetical protein